jgi:hypothetical protein
MSRQVFTPLGPYMPWAGDTGVISEVDAPTEYPTMLPSLIRAFEPGCAAELTLEDNLDLWLDPRFHDFSSINTRRPFLPLIFSNGNRPEAGAKE